MFTGALSGPISTYALVCVDCLNRPDASLTSILVKDKQGNLQMIVGNLEELDDKGNTLVREQAKAMETQSVEIFVAAGLSLSRPFRFERRFCASAVP